ncbi:MAG TPA: NADH-quinone oxidoreductase subunit J [Candidatus Limnocylindrales bacterium]|nr:NADH-quinone oxidoreductase subunit J [Candidatus Limnocylindrales bacterium]
MDAAAAPAMTPADAIFYAVAVVALIGGLGVALSKHIIYSALSLMISLMGVAGLFLTLSADFVAGVQLLVYVGGVLVLTLFAVMLTQGIQDVAVSNRGVGRLAGGAITLAVFIVMARAVTAATWATAKEPLPPVYSTNAVGDLLLGKYVLPFEVASIVLLAVLVGAVVLTRKETVE